MMGKKKKKDLLSGKEDILTSEEPQKESVYSFLFKRLNQ